MRSLSQGREEEEGNFMLETMLEQGRSCFSFVAPTLFYIFSSVGDCTDIEEELWGSSMPSVAYIGEGPREGAEQANLNSAERANWS